MAVTPAHLVHPSPRVLTFSSSCSGYPSNSNSSSSCPSSVANSCSTSCSSSPCFFCSSSASSSSSSVGRRRPQRRYSSGSIGFAGIKKTWKHQSLRAHTMDAAQGNVTSPKRILSFKDEPDHLLVLVHGILASPSDWTYVEAELKRRLGRNFLIYASSSNSFTKTFTGIDGAGKRLADEVLQVVKKTESLKKISFLAHSLGGLFARVAVAVLYAPNSSADHPADISASSDAIPNPRSFSNKGTIAGLEPINFITLATPHLGVRGNKQVMHAKSLSGSTVAENCFVSFCASIYSHKVDSLNFQDHLTGYFKESRPFSVACLLKQLPFLLGVSFLEKIAAPLAPIFVGRTGSQLFLTDGKPQKPPLLLRMASDCVDGKFISGLGAFRSRIVYANVSYDHMVGWRTSSIRRETELVKPPLRSLDGYKHVVDVEYCPPILSDGPHFLPEAARAKEAAQDAPNTQNTVEYHEIMEEEMIRGLQQLGWKKVDVSFHSAFWPFFAHNNIHVKNEWFHNAGAGVITHVADSINQQEKQQDSSTHIAASL